MKKTAFLITVISTLSVLSGCMSAALPGFSGQSATAPAALTPASAASLAGQILPEAVAEQLSIEPAALKLVVDQGKLAGQTLDFGPAYHAASGRTCRQVQLAGVPPVALLACQRDEDWVLVRTVI